MQHNLAMLFMISMAYWKYRYIAFQYSGDICTMQCVSSQTESEVTQR